MEVNYGILSIIPPIVAITLCFATKQVLVSMFAGLFAGALIIAPVSRLIAFAVDPAVNSVLGVIGGTITAAAEQSPLVMGFLLGGIMKMICTSPLSSMALTAMLGLTDKAGDIMRTVDKLDKIGAEKVRDLLTAEDIGLTADQAGEILTFISIQGSNQQVLSALESYRGRNEVFDQGLDELHTVVKYLSAFGVPEKNFAVDLTIARGLDYYTGTVYETTMLDHPEIGSVCSGGRYDNLAEYYTDKQLPGVGISIGLTRLFYVLQEQGMLNEALNSAPADALILPMTGDLGPAAALATQLRQAGVRTQLYTEQKKFKQKMTYADRIGVPYVLFLGDDEIAKGTVSVKDMATGEQVALPAAEAAEYLQKGLAGQGNVSPIKE